MSTAAASHEDLRRYPELHDALAAIAGRCDFAQERDGVGFDATDTYPGHWLAYQDLWTPGQARRAWEMARKYQGQLEPFGIFFEELPEPEPVAIDGRLHPHVIADDEPHHWRLRFEYNRALVNAVRRLPGRRWCSGDKVWVCPGSPALREFVAAHGFILPADAGPADLEREPAGSEEPEEPARAIERDGDSYTIAFPYDKALVAAVKQIPGRRWNPDGKVWTVPAGDMGTLDALASFAGEHDFDVPADLDERLASLQAEAAANLLASQAKEADYDEPAGLGGTLYAFQKAAVKFIATRLRVLVADTMGLGKTIEALAALLAARAFPALIVVPASLKLNWKREAERWLPGKTVAVLDGSDASDVDADIYVINYDVLHERGRSKAERKKRGVLRDDLAAIAARCEGVVFDEFHYAKNRKALRTRACHEIADAGASVVVGLTGTPVLSRPAELIEPLRILGRFDEVAHGWKDYVETFCAAWRDRFGWHVDGASNTDELNARLRRAGIYLRRTKEQVLPDLPDKRRVTVTLPIDNRREYDKAAADFEFWLRENVGSAAAAKALRAEQLTRIGALKQLAARGKIAASKEWIGEFAEAGEPLVVFTYHREIMRALLEEFPEAVHIDGSCSAEQRQDAVDAFQDGDAPLIFCQIRAAGVGLTLTRASNVAFLEHDWTPAAHDQAEDRCHRIGQDESVTAYYLEGEGTIDGDILELIEAKRQVVDEVTDGAGDRKAEAAGILGDLLKRLTTA